MKEILYYWLSLALGCGRSFPGVMFSVAPLWLTLPCGSAPGSSLSFFPLSSSHLREWLFGIIPASILVVVLAKIKVSVSILTV